MDPARVGVILAVALACYLERAFPHFLRAERVVRGRAADWVQYASLAIIAGLASSVAFPPGGALPLSALGPRAAGIVLAIGVAAAGRRPFWGTLAGVSMYLLLSGMG